MKNSRIDPNSFGTGNLMSGESIIFYNNGHPILGIVCQSTTSENTTRILLSTGSIKQINNDLIKKQQKNL